MLLGMMIVLPFIAVGVALWLLNRMIPGLRSEHEAERGRGEMSAVPSNVEANQ